MTLGETTYIVAGTVVCAGPCNHPACGVSIDEFAMLGDLIRKGDTDALAEYMSTDLDAEAEQAAERTL